MANSVELVEKLGRDYFYAHFLGFDYINGKPLPDLAVAKNRMVVLIGCKGISEDDEAVEEYRKWKNCNS